VGAEQAEETIGQRLRRLRLERGLTQRALAKRGVGYAYISRLERGERVPSMKALRALAGGLGVTVQYLETGQDLSDAELRELRLGEAELSLRLEENPAAAERALHEVLADAVAHGDRRDETRARIGLGFAAAHRGDHVEAVALLEEAVAESWVTPRSQPDVFATLGHSYACTGHADKGIEILRRAIDELTQSEPVDAAAVVRFTTYLSYALSDLGDLEGAQTALATALSHSATASDPYTRIRLYWSNARLASRSGDGEMARLSINRAIALLEATEDTGYLARAHILAAEFAIYADDLDTAEQHLDGAENLVGTASELQDQAWLRIQRAFVNARRGDAALAIDQASEAIDLLRSDEDPLLRGRAQWALGEALAAVGTTSAARAAFTRASELIPPGSKHSTEFVHAWMTVFPADAEADIR
jgi:transcriptional regulator with XRE-family HTH domain/predicted negative regulator of RcsB-dependent stress response